MAVYIPNTKQIEAHIATEQFIGYGGAMGGGKTRWICEMAKLLSVAYPGNFGVIARQSGPALKVSTMEVFFDEVLRYGSEDWKALGCKFSKNDGLLTFENLDPPSKIWFTGLDSNNTERIKSLNLGFFCLDEATEIAESIFMMLQTRLRRPGIPKMHRKGIVTANPEAGWIKRRFIDKKLPDHRFIMANYKDNPHLPDDYIDLFQTMPLNWRQRYLDGNWGAVSGLIYKEFDENYHIIPDGDIIPDWDYKYALDHGQLNPACCIGAMVGYKDSVYLKQWIGEDRYDNMNPLYDDYPVVIIHKAYYSSGLISDHKKGIAEIFKDCPSSITHTDPSIWARDREKIVGDGNNVPYSVAQEYMESPNPITGMVRANNKVSVGINRISQLLRIGHLFFMDNETLSHIHGSDGEIRTYSWKRPRTEDEDYPEVPEKKNDHAMDALRYLCMSMPALQADQATVIPYNSFMAARKRAIEAKRGRKVAIIGGRLTGL